MNATEYSRDLADTIYREVRFSIDGDQFDTELKSVDAHAWGWHDNEQEARAFAQDMANEANQTVEVGVYGFWGHGGVEYVESINVEPRV